MEIISGAVKLSQLRWDEEKLTIFSARENCTLKSGSKKLKHRTNPPKSLEHDNVRHSILDDLEDIGELERRTLPAPKVGLKPLREIHAVAGSDVKVYFIIDGHIFQSPPSQFLMIKVNEETPETFSLHFGNWTHPLVRGRSKIYIREVHDDAYFLFCENEFKSTLLVLPSYQSEPFKQVILKLMNTRALPRIPIDSDFKKILAMRDYNSQALKPMPDNIVHSTIQSNKVKKEATNHTNSKNIPAKLKIGSRMGKTKIRTPERASPYLSSGSGIWVRPCLRNAKALEVPNVSKTTVHIINHGNINQVTVTFQNTVNIGMDCTDGPSAGEALNDVHKRRLVSTL